MEMKVWLTTVFILFTLVHAFQWAKGAMLPLPLYVLAGAFLAITSNYEKGLAAVLNASKSNTSQAITPTSNPFIQTATIIEDSPRLESKD
jgi:hypothetical protein